MKKNISIVTLLCGFALLVAGAIILSSCEGPAGPTGPQGEQGEQGLQGDTGPQGPAGEDGNGTCSECHDADVVLFAKEQQTLSSHHLTGGNYERSSADCAPCHTHQGFVEKLATGSVAADIVDPAPINCRTCHMIHMTYTDADWELATTDPVEFMYGGETANLANSSNICVNCHQMREVDPDPAAGGEVTITSSRWGGHHGPQGSSLWGTGGAEVVGSLSYPTPGSHPHAASAGCKTCHMAPVPYGGRAAGGHTFNMTYEYHGNEMENIGGCTGCHSSLEAFDYNGVQTEIEELLTELGQALIAKGWLNESSGLWNASSDAPIVVTADEAGAMLNWEMVEQDRSMGVHNPPYIKALLTNSIEAVSAAK